MVVLECLTIAVDRYVGSHADPTSSRSSMTVVPVFLVKALVVAALVVAVPLIVLPGTAVGTAVGITVAVTAGITMGTAVGLADPSLDRATGRPGSDRALA